MTNVYSVSKRDPKTTSLCTKIIENTTECVNTLVNINEPLIQVMLQEEDAFFKNKIHALSEYLPGLISYIYRLMRWAENSLQLGYQLQDEEIQEAHKVASETKNLAFTMVVLRKAIADRSAVLASNSFIHNNLDITYVKLLDVVKLLENDDDDWS